MNYSMMEKLELEVALDVSSYRTEEGVYKLPPTFFQEDKDYCDASREAWIWSIGRNVSGEIYAATDGRYYQANGWVCLWLR